MNSPRIALVTGASRGIGRSAAMALAASGHHVIAIARTVGGLEELDDAIGGGATLVPLDLRAPDGIENLALAVLERFGRLDVLVAAAGVLGPISPLGHVGQKDWDETLNINLTANWRLIRALDPLMRKSVAARAVFVTSGAAHKANAYWGPYAVSKAALDALVRTWANESLQTSIRANLLSPGPIATRMRANAVPGEDPATLPQPDDLAPAILKLCEADFTETGKVFDFRANALREFRSPL